MNYGRNLNNLEKEIFFPLSIRQKEIIFFLSEHQNMFFFQTYKTRVKMLMTDRSVDRHLSPCPDLEEDPGQ